MKPFKKVLMVCGGVTLVLLTIAALGYALTDIPSAAASLKENEAKARAAGLFITPQEYIDSITVPDSENAASIMAPVLKKYEAKYKEAKFEDTSKKTIDRPLVLAAYADLGPEWKQIDEAAKFKYCIFPRDRSLLIDISYTEEATMRGYLRLATLRADLAKAENDAETATVCWRRAALLSLKLDDEPSYFTSMTRRGCTTTICESLRRTLVERGQESSWRKAVWNCLTILDQPYDFEAEMRYEHIARVDSVDAVLFPEPPEARSEGQAGCGTEYAMALHGKIPRMASATRSRLHEMYAGFFSKLQHDPYEYKSKHDACTWIDSVDTIPPSYMVVQFLVPSMDDTFKPIARDYARRNTLMQAIKLLENPSAEDLPLKGRYALDSDGKPLRLIRKPNKLLIYSIGPNDIDDGGILEKPTKGYTRDYDFGIEIAR